ncbi:hypothetical protein L0F63_006142 [Massospora cicadina]|nr:hypothetical protein L0F63_006142 [Massospora cicadina]
MACEEELSVASNCSDIYRSFFVSPLPSLCHCLWMVANFIAPYGLAHLPATFNCVVQFHEHWPDAGNDALIHLSLTHWGTPPKVSILDDVLLGWIDVYVEHCINTRRWTSSCTCTSAAGGLGGDRGSQLRATTDFSILRHKLLDLILVTLPCYYRKLNSRLAFASTPSLSSHMGLRGFDPELDCANPARHWGFSDAILDRLGIGQSSRVTSSSPSNLYTDHVASLLSESEPKFPELRCHLGLCKFLLHKSLECFGFLSSTHERFMTGKLELADELDRKLVSWDMPFEIHVALCIAGADFLFALVSLNLNEACGGHTQDAYALYYELVEKLSMAWKARSAPMVSDLPAWFQNFGSTKDGSYLDAYANFSPSALYGHLRGDDPAGESLIEFITLLTMFPYGAITVRLLEDEDISLHGSTTTSMYGIGEPLAFLTITNDLFAARCFKRIVISLEAQISRHLNFGANLETMMFGWPYWEQAFDLHILSLLHSHPKVILLFLLENVKHPHYAIKLLQMYEWDPSHLKLKSPNPSNNQPDHIVAHLTTLLHTPTPAQGWDAYLKPLLSDYLKSLTLGFR